MPANFVTVRDIPLGELARFPGNARRGDVTAIRESVRRHGQYRALVVRDTGSGLVVLAGNHTRDALDAEGAGSARCEVITCTDDEARRINLADNRLAELGGYDDADLAALLSGLDGDFGGTGWAQEDLDALLAGEPESRTDPDDVPEPPAEPVTRPGDMWRLGPHRLLCGDSTVVTDVERLMAGDLADLVYTDPPYGVGYTGGAKPREALQGDQLGTTIYGDALPLLQVAAADHAALYLWYADAHAAAAAAAAAAAGYVISAQVIWVKNNAQFVTSAHYKGKHEPCYYAHRKGKSARWYGPNNEVTVWEADRANRNEWHPTQKPVELGERAMRNSSPEGGIVLDLFGGSGSTLIAAHLANRVARIMELDPVYCDVICQRYADHTGVKPVLLEAASANAG